MRKLIVAIGLALLATTPVLAREPAFLDSLITNGIRS
jgi:hypothetical protein